MHLLFLLSIISTEPIINLIILLIKCQCGQCETMATEAETCCCIEKPKICLAFNQLYCKLYCMGYTVIKLTACYSN